MELPIKLAKGATMPARGSKLAAGLDLSANMLEWDDKRVFIKPGERKMISTGVFAAIPVGYYGRVAPRSGLALRHGIDVLAGVIDSDYRGEINVMLINNDSNKVFTVSHGDRIAQLIIEKIAMLEPVQVESLNETKRGDAGYGSTGVNAALDAFNALS